MISKLFLRLYILVVLTLVGVGWSLDRVLDAISDTDKEPDVYAAVFDLIGQRLAQTDKSKWQQTIKEYRSSLQLPISLEPLSAIVSTDDGQGPGLASGEIVSTSDATGETLFQRVGDSESVLSLGPLGLSRPALGTVFILTAVFYTCLAIAILLWVWPLWKNIRILSRATARFGQGDFNARALVGEKSGIAPLAHSFNSMADRIQRLIDSHKELTHAVSHDLRTPLARMRFGIDMLEVGNAPADRQRYMESMRADVDELETLINEMLTYAKFDRDAPDLSMKTIGLSRWLKKVSDDLQPLSQDKQIHCDVDDSDSLKTFMEPAYMARAVANLVTNALRYAATQVRISCSASDDWLCIAVDDDGPGVPEKDRKRIFEAFKKQDSTRDRKYGGFGLGLSIVSRIVQWHGGHVDVSESALGGARFQIHLPRHQVDLNAA